MSGQSVHFKSLDRRWNFADVWEVVAGRFPDAAALLAGERIVTWRAFDERADGIAAVLLGAGLGRQAKVAQYLFNSPEYLESVFACFKAGLVPVNTNYRYTDDELAYLWANADVEAVIFHSDLTDRCERLRARMPDVKVWLWVDAGDADAAGGVRPDWAVSYEEAAGQRPGHVRSPWGRSGDDLFLLYTGGTTGRPKGVMWPQDTLFRMLEESNGRHPDLVDGPDAHAMLLERSGPRVLPAPPLMHGTALWFAMPALSVGGAVVTIPDRRFDPAGLLDALARHNVKGLCIVGDAFARPIADALEAEPGMWDLSLLRVVLSSGVMFSAETKARLLAHAPNAVVIDSLGSSESGSVARSQTSNHGGRTATGAFRIGPRTRVVDADGRDVQPGSGTSGRLAVTGHVPVGYHGDPAKSAETFVTIDGVVHVITGDHAEVDTDGTIRLLGRGSVCINTGGEKVFPEEVEEALKAVDGVRDAVVVGVPDERFGETVVAIVEAAPGIELRPDSLVDAVRRRLAGYKVPRHVLLTPINRAANGKADYRGLRNEAIAALM